MINFKKMQLTEDIHSKIVLRDFSGNVMEESVNDVDIIFQNIKVGNQVHFEMNQIVKNTK